MTSENIILVLCLGALAAFVFDRFRKLPKSVFVFFAVAIVSSVCWNILDSGSEKSSRVSFSAPSETLPVVFSSAAKDVLLPPGETRIALPVLVSGKREYDCVRFVFELPDSDVSEQRFIENVGFSLLFPDGTLVPASALSIGRGEDSSFPSRFVLKAFFPTASSSSGSVRCIVENGLSRPLFASDISVGSRPAPDAADSVAEEGASE